ncbi:helix-turn-helix domain-containing protein [Hyphobacterium sp.]|uniref:helix-turn-helix domain-containing protein n=1 Tax=Hyphobacterium sp. TaxID=2004662 RepID=UPI003BAB08F3
MPLSDRKRILLDAPDMSVRLCWYAPGEIMSAHRHELGQVSVLMSGSFRETGDARSADNQTAQIGFKPAGFEHENRYDETGALILSVNIAENGLRNCPGWHWQAATPAELDLARRIVLSSGERDIIGQCARDLVALMADRQALDRHPPPWARELRDRLLSGDSVDLDAAARTIGIHRAHLSRGFRKWYGTPPSVFALRCRMSRAVKALVAGEPAAHAAVCAGFADQSHFIRTMRRETGITPARLSRLLAA